MKKFKVFIRHDYYKDTTKKILDFEREDAASVREELLEDLVRASFWSNTYAKHWQNMTREIVICEVIEDIQGELEQRITKAREEKKRKEEEEEANKVASGYYLRPEEIAGNKVMQTKYALVGIYVYDGGRNGDRTKEEIIDIEAQNDEEAIKKAKKQKFESSFVSNETFFCGGGYPYEKNHMHCTFRLKRKTLTKIETYEKRSEWYGNKKETVLFSDK